MKTIPQRTLRNESGAILRRAGAGETFVVTVHGRPVAVLGPIEARQWVGADSVRELFSTRHDPILAEDLQRSDPGPPDDPWAR